MSEGDLEALITRAVENTAGIREDIQGIREERPVAVTPFVGWEHLLDGASIASPVPARDPRKVLQPRVREFGPPICATHASLHDIDPSGARVFDVPLDGAWRVQGLDSRSRFQTNLDPESADATHAARLCPNGETMVIYNPGMNRTCTVELYNDVETFAAGVVQRAYYRGRSTV
jgi:ferredoxin